MTIAYDQPHASVGSAAVHAPRTSPLSMRLAETALAVAAVVGMTATVSVGPAAATNEHRRLETRRPVDGPVAGGGIEASGSDREVIAWLKDNSGLTMEQIAQAMGVSRRAIHLWQNGRRLSAANATALRNLAAVVHGNLRESADLTRSALLAVGVDGLNTLDRFRSTRDFRPLERALAEISVGQQVAGHHPSAEDLERASRILRGELTPDDARAELIAKFRK